MSSAVGTFTVEDSFRITGRGLVLLGDYTGQVIAGYQMVFANGTRWGIKGVDHIRVRSRQNKLGLLVDAPLATSEELVQRGIIGATAQLFAP